MTDLSEIAEELQSLPHEVRKGFARLTGLKELTACNAFQSDMVRLDQQQRAIRKQQGLDMPEGDDDVAGINNIMADNITITDGVKRGEVNVPPVSQPTTNRMGWLGAGLLGGAGMLTAANLGWMMGGSDNDPPPAATRPTIERESVPLGVEYE